MRKLFRPLCLTALIAVAPTVLIGCSGGSSSNNSSSTQSANVTFTTLDNQPYLQPINLRGDFKPKKYNNGVPDLTEGKGIYSYRSQAQGEPEGTDTLVTAAILNTGEAYQAFYIVRNTTTGFDGPVGTVYQFNSNPYFSVELFRRLRDDNPFPVAVYFILTGGSATVTANDGKTVTLQLQNVELRNIIDGAPEPLSIKVSGSVTYRQDKIDQLNLIPQTGTTAGDMMSRALGKSLKN